MVKLTFNDEFDRMLYVCMLVPFLASDMPKPTNFKPSVGNRDADAEIVAKINHIIELRKRIKKS